MKTIIVLFSFALEGYAKIKGWRNSVTKETSSLDRRIADMIPNNPKMPVPQPSFSCPLAPIAPGLHTGLIGDC